MREALHEVATMSDPEFYRSEVRRRTNEMLDKVMSDLIIEDLSDDDIAALSRTRKARFESGLEEQFEAGLWSKVERVKLIEFVDRLIHRQGTPDVDFEEFYQHRAELDRSAAERDD